jgi:hypothetical protein
MARGISFYPFHPKFIGNLSAMDVGGLNSRPLCLPIYTQFTQQKKKSKSSVSVEL